MLSPSLDSSFLKKKKLKLVKKLLKLRFLDNLSKAEGEKCDQEDWNKWLIWNYYTLFSYLLSGS